MSESKEISDVRWLEHGKEGYLMQFCTIDDKVHQRDPTEYSVMIMNAMSTPMDLVVLKEGGENGEPPRLPSLNDIPWSELHDGFKEALREYRVFGDDTRVIRRMWFREDNGDIVPVIVKSENSVEVGLFAEGVEK